MAYRLRLVVAVDHGQLQWNTSAQVSVSRQDRQRCRKRPSAGFHPCQVEPESYPALRAWVVERGRRSVSTADARFSAASGGAFNERPSSGMAVRRGALDRSTSVRWRREQLGQGRSLRRCRHPRLRARLSTRRSRYLGRGRRPRRRQSDPRAGAGPATFRAYEPP